MTEPKVLLEAEFNRKVRTYWLLSGILVCVATVFGIVLVPVWLLVGNWATERYLRHMSCVLTERSLKVKRGIMVRREMTVPLDKITDVGLVEGPIMRMLDLQAVKIETAGQSASGAAVQLVGIVGTRDFRDAILRQRDKVVERLAGEAGAGPAATVETGDTAILLSEIRDVLQRIEQQLARRDSA